MLSVLLASVFVALIDGEKSRVLLCHEGFRVMKGRSKQGRDA